MMSPNVGPLTLTLMFVFIVQADKQEVTSISAAAKEIGLDVSVAAVLSERDGISTLKEKQIKTQKAFFLSQKTR